MNKNPTELKTFFEQHEDSIKRIFVMENLQPILALIHSIRPPKSEMVKESEYLTIVNAAKNDAYDEIMTGIALYIANNSNINNSNVLKNN